MRLRAHARPGPAAHLRWRGVSAPLAARPRSIILLYIASVTLSFLGSGIQNICVPWMLLELTHSPMSVGMVLVVRGLIIVLLSPHAGALSDCGGRRRLATASHYLAGAAVLVLAAWLHTSVVSIGALYAATIVVGIGSSYFVPASSAHIYLLVPKTQYAKVSSAREIGMQLGVIGGAFVGGLMLQALSLWAVFAIVGLTYVASGALFHLLPADTRSTPAGPPPGGGLGNIDSVRVILAERKLTLILLLLMVPTLAIQVDNVLASGYVQQVLRFDVMSFSIINSGYSAGALASALLMGRMHGKLTTPAAAAVAFLMLGAAHLLFGTSTQFGGALLAMTAIGATVVPLRILLNTALMAAAGDALLGRAQAALQFFSSIVMVLVGLCAGLAAVQFGYASAFFLIFWMSVIGAAARLWGLERLDPAASATDPL